MTKALPAAAAIALLIAAPAYAQTAEQPARPGMATANGAAGAAQDAFLARQMPDEWRGSKLLGASVYGPGDKSIGDINDIIVGPQGEARAVVIGVGGFLGIGEKSVAVPFHALRIVRKANASTVERVTITVTKEQLQEAPKFVYLEANGANNTTAGGNRPGAQQKSSDTNASGAGMTAPRAPAHR